MLFHQSPAIFPATVYLRVTNLHHSKQFYNEILGLQILKETNDTISFTVDGHKPILVITEPTNVIPRKKRTAGLFHFALLLPTRKDLGKILRHFIKHDIQIGASDHIVSEALYIDDPDGNGIEIYADRNHEEWDWVGKEVNMPTIPLDADSVINASEGETFSRMPKDTVMGHIHLQVQDLMESKVFYEKLGLEVMAMMPRAIFMANNGYHHHIGMNTWTSENASKPDAQAAGLMAYTLVYPNEESLEKALHHIQIDEDVRTIIDPSGIRITLEVEK